MPVFEYLYSCYSLVTGIVYKTRTPNPPKSTPRCLVLEYHPKSQLAYVCTSLYKGGGGAWEQEEKQEQEVQEEEQEQEEEEQEKQPFFRVTAVLFFLELQLYFEF